MLFTQVLESLVVRDGVGTATVSEDWLQGRSLFGGIQTALAVRAMRNLVPAEVPLRVAQTTFIAPVEAGEVRVSAQVLRAGKSTTHVEARIHGATGPACIVIGVFGRGRPSKVSVVPRVPPVVVVPDPVDFPYVPGISADFFQHFTLRWLSGPTLFSGTKEAPHAVVDVGMRDSAPASEAHAIAIADVIPPLALTMLTEQAPGSSVTWTLEMLTDRFDTLPLKDWRMHAELRAGRDSYASQAGLLCGPSGQPVAFSNQSMMTFG